MTTTLVRALNKIDQTRPLPKKIYLLKYEIKENDIIVILLMDIVLVWQMETRRKMHI